MKNRLKKREDTLCDYTVCGKSIKEGDILGYCDNFPGVVLYNKFEGRFEVIEPGYPEEGFRRHSLRDYTVKWKVLGDLESSPKLLKDYPKDFDYTDYLSGFYL
jgi:hypothetical protein